MKDSATFTCALRHSFNRNTDVDGVCAPDAPTVMVSAPSFGVIVTPGPATSAVPMASRAISSVYWVTPASARISDTRNFALASAFDVSVPTR